MDNAQRTIFATHEHRHVRIASYESIRAEQAKRSRTHLVLLRRGAGPLRGLAGSRHDGSALRLRALCRCAHAGGAGYVADSHRPLAAVPWRNGHPHPSAGRGARFCRFWISRLPARNPRFAGPQRRNAHAHFGAAGQAQRDSLRRSPELRPSHRMDPGLP